MVWDRREMFAIRESVRKIPVRGYCGLMSGCVSLWERKIRGRTVCDTQPNRKWGTMGKEETKHPAFQSSQAAQREQGWRITDRDFVLDMLHSREH